MFVSRNLLAFMGLAAVQGFATELESLLKPFQSGCGRWNGGFGAKDPVESSRYEFLERRSALSGGYPGAVKEVVRKIDGRFHEQYLRLYG